MARKKKKGANTAAPPMVSSGRRSIDTSIEDAENGWVVRVSGETGDGGYHSKKFIATTEPKALRIAHQGMQGLLTPKKGGGKKKGGKKAVSRKKV